VIRLGNRVGGFARRTLPGEREITNRFWHTAVRIDLRAALIRPLLLVRGFEKVSERWLSVRRLSRVECHRVRLQMSFIKSSGEILIRNS
jgi:hypothetical protein